MVREYKKPMMVVERFVTDECVAACGDVNKEYKFVCDASNPNHQKFYYYPETDGTVDGSYTGNGRPSVAASKSYEPCGITHNVSVNSKFFDGFIDYNNNRKQDQGEGVIVWQEDEGLGEAGIFNYHATTKLKMDEWETLKS